MVEAAEKKLGLDRARTSCYLGEKRHAAPASIGPRHAGERADGPERDRRAARGPATSCFVLLIGHGSFQSGESRFNLRART